MNGRPEVRSSLFKDGNYSNHLTWLERPLESKITANLMVSIKPANALTKDVGALVTERLLSVTVPSHPASKLEHLVKSC